MDQTPTHQHRILVISISSILSGAGTIAPTSTSLICQDICAWQVHSNILFLLITISAPLHPVSFDRKRPILHTEC